MNMLAYSMNRPVHNRRIQADHVSRGPNTVRHPPPVDGGATSILTDRNGAVMAAQARTANATVRDAPRPLAFDFGGFPKDAPCGSELRILVRHSGGLVVVQTHDDGVIELHQVNVRRHQPNTRHLIKLNI
jgi:hypothetical protein